eukprot:TRINITY_DN44055_c0_g1_i1.p1 TRINITY_DN44055_c0_g1~~TRINITY_DN44055_c0_g1_i1.p1  ORF type:complete len:198 (-),score=56.84 TRINITY_DN44055_c0_g1_i1:199-792(-)
MATANSLERLSAEEKLALMRELPADHRVALLESLLFVMSSEEQSRSRQLRKVTESAAKDEEQTAAANLRVEKMSEACASAGQALEDQEAMLQHVRVKLLEEATANHDLFDQHQALLTEYSVLQASHSELQRQLFELTDLYQRERQRASTSNLVKRALYGVCSPINSPSSQAVGLEAGDKDHPLSELHLDAVNATTAP